MALTHEQFRAVGNRAEAFTISLFGMGGTRRRMASTIANWLDAIRTPARATEAERHRRRALLLARELRSDLDVLIAEIEADESQAVAA